TDPSIEVPVVEDDDEKTPVVDVESFDEHVAAREAATQGPRWARPTTPIVDRAKRAIAAGSPGGGIELPAEELLAPVAEPAIPLEDQPTALAANVIDLARVAEPPPPPLAAPRPRRPESTPSHGHAVVEQRPPRASTGPQLPIMMLPRGGDIADAPTHITGARALRADPTDVS